ncbi:hypothetical protein K2173_015172 [Erythroxylum novogranatense]|uniref:Uncharacterized protein n=1 Tax=Erythroxylum novogranatense TaxID=1862640 RepID=A0AAV8T2M2_9ROSI|nr:hypothetical protein K2173_015172 [Erythroxylum novogranatense]
MDSFRCVLIFASTISWCLVLHIPSHVKAIDSNVIDLARKETTNVRDFFISLIDSKDTKPTSKEPLKICADYFNASIVEFSVDGLEGETITLDIHAALENCENCEATLNINNIYMDPISAKIQAWKAVYSAASAFTHLLQNNAPGNQSDD